MAMRFRDLNDDIIADLGGRDRLSTGQLRVCGDVAYFNHTIYFGECCIISTAETLNH